jgi:hypothetical protein
LRVEHPAFRLRGPSPLRRRARMRGVLAALAPLFRGSISAVSACDSLHGERRPRVFSKMLANSSSQTGPLPGKKAIARDYMAFNWHTYERTKTGSPRDAGGRVRRRRFCARREAVHVAIAVFWRMAETSTKT